MKQLRSDLWQCTAERPLADFPQTVSHAYLLTRPSGNILFYCPGREAIGTPDVGDTLDRIAGLGGVAHVLLAHWHEATPPLAEIKARFAAEIVVHARDAAMVEREGRTAPDRPFWDRGMVAGDVEAIPTPGHTVGSACYRYRSPGGGTYLVTGDTIWRSQGKWTSVSFEDDGEQSNHRASLDTLATLAPDLVLAAIGNPDTASTIEPADWPAATAETKARLG